MKWARVQRWSALFLIVLLIAATHVTVPSLTASKALSLLVLLTAAVHVTSSAYVVLTDQRGLAQHSRLVAGVVLALGAASALYGGAVILRANGPKPILGHLPGSDCKTCHTRDEHVRWPLSLHEPRGAEPTAACEDCHGVTVASPKLLAVRDPKSGEQVPATAVETCLECHNPRQSEKPVWPGAIHATIKCGTCHSHITSAEEPSWKRACQKCHPRAEDVHIDVKSLDTTYLSRASKNDVHTMKCAACHGEMQ